MIFPVPTSINDQLSNLEWIVLQIIVECSCAASKLYSEYGILQLFVMTLISLATDLLIVSTYFYHKVTDRLWVSEIFLPMLNYFFFAFENIFYWNVKCIWSWIFGKIMKFLWSQATLFSKSVGISTLFSLPFPITIIAYSPVVHVHLFPMTTEFLHLRHPARHSQHLQFCFCVSSACCLIAGGVRTRWRMICWYW